MIKGIGIDIIEIQRIKRAVHKNNRFINRILTSNEQEMFNTFTSEKRKLEFLAGRFAAKEAFAKATAQGIGTLSFQHIEILSKRNGAPKMTVEGYEREEIFISISHSEQYAVAQVIITSK